MQVVSIRKNHEKAQSALDHLRMKMKECDSQITGIAKEQQQLQVIVNETNLERKKMENEVTC